MMRKTGNIQKVNMNETSRCGKTNKTKSGETSKTRKIGM
jgi:hypothetical protein